MPIPIKTKRGLEFKNPEEIAEAMIFCDLEAKNKQDQEDQRLVALKLYKYFTKHNNHKKAMKYGILATNSKPNDEFQFNFTEATVWYNILRVFIGSVNRLFAFFKWAFLPAWFALTGLFYGVQALVVHQQAKNEKGDVREQETHNENKFYWSVWTILNGFGCLVTFGVLAASGVGLPIAALVVGLYSFLFDVQWDSYKYTTERRYHERLLKKLKVNNQYKEMHDTLKNNIEKMKGDRIEGALMDSTVMIGGVLFCLSAFFPPIFASIGASCILAAFTYLVAKKIHISWNSPTGLLNNYVNKPLTKFYENPGFYLNKYIAQPIRSLGKKLRETTIEPRREVLTLQIPERSESLPLIHSESDVAYDTGVSESRPTSPVGSLKMLPVEVATELNEAVNIIPVVAKLEPKTQKIVKEILTSESHLPWNETLGVYQTKYEEQKKMDVYQTKFKEQKKDEFYNCPIQQSMKICQKFLKSMIRKERKTRQWEDVRSLERKAGLLEKLNGRFSGKNEDLELIKLSREEFNGEDLHSTKTEIVKLLKVLGIDNYEKYKAQYIIWEKYYHNTKRINSPFFDRPLERCGFEARNQEITTIPTAVICRM